ncbi:hypothetical protein HRbin39_01423 [bacterium HR39]|nr:hypothetical protein HRbin39_01423 [bacterium HR39]
MRVTDEAWPGAMYPPTIGDIATVAERLLRELPEPFRGLAGYVPVKVEEWPDEETLEELGIEDPLDLTGIYEGVPVGERVNLALPPERPEMIRLFRMPILYEWCERGCSLEEVVFDVLMHEIGHHFGMNEDEVRAMEEEARRQRSLGGS